VPFGQTYPTKELIVMTEKKLVHRDTTQRSHIYVAAIEEGMVQQGMVRNVIDRFFQGSTKDLIMHALGHEETSNKELEEIKRLIDKLESEQK